MFGLAVSLLVIAAVVLLASCRGERADTSSISGASTETQTQQIASGGRATPSARGHVATFTSTFGLSKAATVAILGPPARTIGVGRSGSELPWNYQRRLLTYEYDVDGRIQRVYFGDDGRVVGIALRLSHGGPDRARMYDGDSFASVWEAAGGPDSGPSVVTETVSRRHFATDRDPLLLDTIVQGSLNSERRVAVRGKCRDEFRATVERRFDTTSSKWVETLAINPRFTWGRCTAYEVIVGSEPREMKLYEDQNYNTLFDIRTGHDIEVTRARAAAAVENQRVESIVRDFYDHLEVRCSPFPFSADRAQRITDPFSLDAAASPGLGARGHTRSFQCRLTVRHPAPPDADVTIPITWGYDGDGVIGASYPATIRIPQGATTTSFDLPGAFGVTRPQVVNMWAKVDTADAKFISCQLSFVW